ncbi:MAG: hypothetical protein WC967_06545 [Balneolaceae bacterium]
MATALQLIAYDKWANDKVLTAISEINDDKLSHACLKLMSHILQAQLVWAHRVFKMPTVTDVWPSYSYQDCRTYLVANTKTINTN